MFKIMVGVAAALSLSLGAFDQAHAQDLTPSNPQTGSSQDSLSARDPQVGSERSQGSLTRGDRPGRQQQQAAPDPAQVIADSQAAATAAGLSCQVTEANLLGDSAQGKVYEAACATGPGYIITASTPPQAVDCVVLATQLAAEAASAQPAAEPQPRQQRRRGQTEPQSQTVSCTLPANQDLLGVQAAYAREAGITCRVDEALPVGATGSGAVVYEIGCAGLDGYRIFRGDAGWVVEECLKLASLGGTCRFTTPDEQHATIAAWLPGTEAAGCAIQQARFMGGNENGDFYEIQCAAAEGYILRVRDQTTEQVYPCAIAQPIGGGCTFTTSPAPAAAPAGRR